MPDLASAQPGDVVSLTPDQISAAQPATAPTPTLQTAQPGQDIVLSPEERQQVGIVDPIADLSADELVKLTEKSPDSFDLLAAFQSRPDLQKNPAVVAKVADAFNELRKPLFQGVTAAGAAKNVLHTFTGLARSAAHATGGTALILNSLGKVYVPGKEGEAEEDLAAGQKSLAELFSSAESSMFGLVSGAQKLAARAGRALGISKSLDDYTPEDKINALYDALAVHQTATDLASGKGEVSQAITGGNPSAQVDPEEVGKLVDPFSWYALGEAFKGAGALAPKVGSAATAGLLSPSEVAALPGNLAGQAGRELANAAGRVAAAIPTAGAKAAEVGKTVSPALTVPGIVVAAAAGHPHALLALLAGGEEGVGNKIAQSFSHAATSMRKVADFAKQVSGDVPLRSAYAQAIRDTLETAPAAALDVGKGAAFDVGQLAAAETPQEREASFGLGTAFGLAGGAARTGMHALSGQIIAPRYYDVKNPIAPSNNYPGLSAIHAAQFQQLDPQQKAWVNGVRSFLASAAPGNDIFVTGKAPVAEVSAALQKISGMDATLADTIARQNGGTINLPDGKRLVVVREAPAAPHEALHAIENVLGEPVMRELDADTKQRYGSTWETFGRNYAARLAGADPGPGWRDVVLDKTQWGRTAAIDKLYRQTAQQFSQEARNTGAPMPTPDQIQAAVMQSFKGLNEDWRSVLTPQEAGEVADRYISREHLAENFDAWFKHAGPTLEPGTQMPEKVARAVAATFTALGINPLAGRETELGVTPDTGTIAALKKAVVPQLREPAAKVPETAPAKAPAAIRSTAPQEPAAASEIAAAAPDEKVPGATMSQREVSQTLANSLGQNQGVRLTYRSAPGEPAAAPVQSRNTRRALIEYARTMPEAQKPLWQKLFFPWRADKQAGGDTTWGGWTPEVFAANANRVAQWAAESGNAALIPYDIDPQAKTFSNVGWRKLFDDVQSFVHNQLAGRTGGGQPLVIPKHVAAAGGFAPELGEAAERKIGQREADFISLLFGTGQLPKTSRISNRSVGLPLSIMGEEVSKATQPGRVQPPVTPRGTFSGEKAAAMGIEGREIQEVNPLRAELEAKGNFPKMLEAYQNLNLRNILHAEPAPEQPRFGGNALTLSAGFQPAEITPEKEARIRERIARGIPPENIRLSVFNDPALPEKYHGIQVDEVDPNAPAGQRNTFSSNPEDMRRFGYDMPTTQELLKLPFGQHTLADAQEMLKNPQAAAQFAPAEEEEKRGPVWYSQLSRIVDSKAPNAATGEHFAAILQNPQNGIKADELKWSGLDDFLKGKERVTKQEVQDFLKQNAVQIQEITKGESNPNVGAWWNDEGGANEEKSFSELTPEERQQAEERYADEVGQYEEGGEGTKFQQYQLSGMSENYREMLFTLPSKSPSLIATKIQNATPGYAPKYEVRDSSGNLIDNVWANSPEHAVRIASKNINDSVFRASHWAEPNVLAHVRFNDRTDNEGNKVKFIEEIQSDWHQQGRKEGYKDSARDPDFKKVPQAPFKTSWHEMVFRRMVRMAAEEGMDKLAWTTGDQQAERYDLSKQLDKVKIGPSATEGLFDVMAFKNGERVVYQDFVPPEDLSNYVGKELAEKALKDGAADRDQTYSGLALKVGGEGMKGFYDKILVDYANKFGKKFGTRAKDIQIPSDAPLASASHRVILENGHEIPFKRLRDAVAYQSSHGGTVAGPSEGQTVHSLPITDEMRRSVLKEGVAQFKPAPNEDVRKTAEEYAKGRGITTPPHTGLAPLNEERAKHIAAENEQAGHTVQYMARKAKQDYEFKESPGSLFSKAWVLPNGKIVQLGGKWHHEWVNENPDVVKQFGLKKTTSGEENRVDALKKGFARVNYERNTGTLKVEARAQDWARLAPSIKEMVRANLGRVDNMDVHLLDAKASRIVEQDGVALHTYDPEERMDHIPLITEPSATTTFSPQSTAETARGQFNPANNEQERILESNEGGSAVRMPDGKIFRGVSHRAALERADEAGYSPEELGNAEDGYLTSKGRFVDRDAGYRIAVKAKQFDPKTYKRIANEEDFHFGGKKPYLETYTFDDAISEKAKKELGSKGVQYQPGGDPRAIRAAAIRDPDTGEVTEGMAHFYARMKHAEEHPGMDPFNYFKFQEGFVDNSGNFLDRVQAFERAKELNQLKAATTPGQKDLHEQFDRTGRLAAERAQFKPSAPEPDEFKDEKTLPTALAKPNWAVLTATQEALGAGTAKVNQEANERLEKELRASGFNPIPVQGNYKGVDQGMNYLVTGMTPDEAVAWGRKFGQESVLTPRGLLYGDGSLNPALPDETTIGERAKKQDFYSQIQGGPAFSMGIDFSKRIPAAEAERLAKVKKEPEIKPRQLRSDV